MNAAREGVGKEGILLIDDGQIWGEDTEAAASRLPALKSAEVYGSRNRFMAALSKPIADLRSAARGCASPAARPLTISSWPGI